MTLVDPRITEADPSLPCSGNPNVNVRQLDDVMRNTWPLGWGIPYNECIQQ